MHDGQEDVDIVPGLTCRNKVAWSTSGIRRGSTMMTLARAWRANDFIADNWMGLGRI